MYEVTYHTTQTSLERILAQVPNTDLLWEEHTPKCASRRNPFGDFPCTCKPQKDGL
jgi:hypothetical protein